MEPRNKKMKLGKKSTINPSKKKSRLKEQSDHSSITRAVAILECIGTGINILGDIKDYCKLSKSTTHRILKALEKSKLVIYDPFTRQYFLGGGLIQILSKPEITHNYLVYCARKEMQRLSMLTEETIVIGVMVGLENIILDSIQSKQPLRVVEVDLKVGNLNLGAPARVLLSQLSDDQVSTVLKQSQNVPNDPGTVQKVITLSQVKKTRERGYAMSSGEKVLGAMGISVPIKSYQIPAVLSIIGPESRMKSKAEDYLDLLFSASNRISESIRGIT